MENSIFFLLVSIFISFMYKFGFWRIEIISKFNIIDNLIINRVDRYIIEKVDNLIGNFCIFISAIIAINIAISYYYGIPDASPVLLMILVIFTYPIRIWYILKEHSKYNK